MNGEEVQVRKVIMTRKWGRRGRDPGEDKKDQKQNVGMMLEV